MTQPTDKRPRHCSDWSASSEEEESPSLLNAHRRCPPRRRAASSGDGQPTDNVGDSRGSRSAEQDSGSTRRGFQPAEDSDRSGHLEPGVGLSCRSPVRDSGRSDGAGAGAGHSVGIPSRSPVAGRPASSYIPVQSSSSSRGARPPVVDLNSGREP